VIVAKSLQVKAIAHDHVKTDRIDAGVLASLRAAGFLPEVWLPDADTQRRRRLVARRNQVVRHRIRIKNAVQAILQAHLGARVTDAAMLGQTKTRLAHPRIEPDIAHELLRRGEAAAVADRGDEACGHDDVDAGDGQEALDGRVLDHLLGDLAVEKLDILGEPVEFAQMPIDCGPIVVRQFLSSEPSSTQPAEQVGMRARRDMLVEAAWAASKAPSPLRSFFLRIRARRGHQVAAVAVARKLAVLCWHLLTRMLTTNGRVPRWSPTRYARCSYRLDSRRKRATSVARPMPTTSRSCALGRSIARHAEHAYEQFVGRWQPRGLGKRRTGAANEERR
jgi:hypothetical protein